MTQTQKFFTFFFFFSVFFIFSTASAQVNKFRTDAELFCPRVSTIPQKINKNPNECKDRRNTENLATRMLKDEAKHFHNEVLTHIHTNNQGNPNHIAQKAIWNLRTYNECLTQICYAVFSSCDPNNKRFSDSFDAERWCKETTEQIFQLGQTQTRVGIEENFARKDRSLMKQKFNAIATRFQEYHQHWMTKTVNNLKAFAQKVTVFIRNPY